MAYVTPIDFLVFAAPNATDNPVDDHTIGQILDAASAYIDRHTRRRFEAVTATRYYDVPRGRELRLDADLLAITTLTNGDGTVIASGDYLLIPQNAEPYYAIRLKAASGLAWMADADGETDGVISVAGSWGYSSEPPEDIQMACLLIARNIYRSRTGETEGAATVTGAGVVITPQSVPALAAEILSKYWSPV